MSVVIVSPSRPSAVHAEPRLTLDVALMAGMDSLKAVQAGGPFGAHFTHRRRPRPLPLSSATRQPIADFCAKSTRRLSPGAAVIVQMARRRPHSYEPSTRGRS